MRVASFLMLDDMATPLKILKVNHINQIVDDYAAAIGHLEDLFGGLVLLDIGPNPLTAGCPAKLGGEIFELLAPKVLDRAEGKQLSRYGPHYQGIEILVPSLPESLQAVRGTGDRDPVGAEHRFLDEALRRPSVCACRSPRAIGTPIDRRPPTSTVRASGIGGGRSTRSATRGSHHISFACEDVVGAERFWCELTGGTVTHRAERPAAAGERRWTRHRHPDRAGRRRRVPG